MEWLTTLKATIDYIETHLLEIKTTNEVANHVYTSAIYLQRGFQIMTGYTIAEYIRNRRLYEAALEINHHKKTKIIDIALKYGYESQDSFTKAFTRFHGKSPLEIRKDAKNIHLFLPFRINIVIYGGNKMDYKIEKTASFTLIGFKKRFKGDTAYLEIPKFWDEINTKFANIYTDKQARTPQEEAVLKNHIGEFAICIDDNNLCNEFDYMIGGKYLGGEVPEGMELFQVPELEWAKFKAIGPLPDALQSVNTAIFKEWLPGNKEFEIAASYNIEWYSTSANTASRTYESAIWVPVRRK